MNTAKFHSLFVALLFKLGKSVDEIAVDYHIPRYEIEKCIRRYMTFKQTKNAAKHIVSHQASKAAKKRENK